MDTTELDRVSVCGVQSNSIITDHQNLFTVVRYSCEFVITVIVITEFDYNFIFREKSWPGVNVNNIFILLAAFAVRKCYVLTVVHIFWQKEISKKTDGEIDHTKV